jgi:hypothetical protein
MKIVESVTNTTGASCFALYITQNLTKTNNLNQNLNNEN